MLPLNSYQKNSSALQIISDTEIFKPFLEKAKPFEIDKIEFIQTILDVLQELEFNYLKSTVQSMRNDFTFDASWLDSLITKYPALKDLIINLAHMYLDETTQKQKFPGYHKAEIQTAIREIFFDYINPLNKFIVKNIDTKAIKPNNYLNQSREITQSDAVKKIFSYLDYKGVFTFRQTCKLMYFQQKSLQDCQSNIFYTSGSDIKVIINPDYNPQKRSLPYLRSDLSENEIIDSIRDQNLNEVRLFKSLYQATEYARLRLNKISMHVPSKDGYIPSLWTVSYVGNPNNLAFVDEIVTLNPTAGGCGTYHDKKCNLSVSYAKVPKDSILPLIGTVIYPSKEFASYTQYQIVDLQKCPQSQTILSRCTMI